MWLSAGVGEHLEHVVLWLIGVEAGFAGVGDLPGAFIGPDRLPFGLDRGRVKALVFGLFWGRFGGH